MNRSTLFLILCTLTAPLRAQFTSSIQGTVTDPSHAAVPSASVRVTNVATGESRKLQTGSDGIYRALSLGLGDYSVEVEKEGFQKAIRKSVSLTSDEALRVNFTLQLGGVAEAVTVSDTPPAVETEQGRVSDQVDATQLKEMPLNGRNIYNIIAVQPGITGTALGGSALADANDLFAGESAPEIYASGQRSESNNFTVDSMNANSVARGGVANLSPNPDSVAEVRVVANNVSAVEGRSSGAQIQVITKRGTNRFHGTLSEYFGNNTLSTRNVFEAQAPVWRKNQFNYTVGGPVIRNRTFFFTSYEGLRQSGGRGVVANVETEVLRDIVLRTRPNSIAAKLMGQFRPSAYPTYNIRDLGSPAAGVNVIGPRDGILDLGSLNFVPAAQRSGNQFSGRLDHELRPGKDRVYLNYYRTNADTLNGGVRPSFDRWLNEQTVYGNINHTHIFDGSKLNEFRAGVMRLVGGRDMPAHLEVPYIVVSGITGFGVNGFPVGWKQTNYTFKDIFSWVKSKHSIQAGGELRRSLADNRNTFNFLPTYNFQNLLDFADDEAIQMTRYVDPRSGEPVTHTSGLRFWEWALFVNDDWKVSRRLTLNIGLRYENYSNPGDNHNQKRALIFGSGATYEQRLASAKVDFVDRFYPTDNLNFAPRFGFAWDVDGKGKTSIRGGYGISYDRLATLPMERSNANPPLRANVILGPQYGTVFTYSLGDPTKPGLGYPIDSALRVGLDARNGLRGTRVSLVSVDSNVRSPYVHNWFFGVQREVLRGLVVESSYIGSAGHHLFSSRDINRRTGDFLPDGKFHGINPSFADVVMVEATSNSIYHGGTVSARQHFRRGLTLRGALTFGKAIDDTDGYTTTALWQDAYNRGGERGLAGFDVSRRFSGMGLWDMPFFKKQNGFLNHAFAGWQIAGFVILQGGRPITPTVTGLWPRGDWNGDGVGGDRPNSPGPDVPRGGWERSAFLNGAILASSFPRPAPGTNGDLGRNTFRGPGFAQTDLSLSKRFRLSERLSLTARFDGFNAFNRVNLNNPIMDVNNISFGRSTTAKAPRVAQLGLRLAF